MAAGHSERELCKLLDVSRAQLNRFLEDDIVQPVIGPGGEARFSFQDVILLRTAIGLRRAAVPHQKIKLALESLRHQLPPGRSPTSVRMTAHGKQVVVRDGALVWSPQSGQALFDFALGEATEELEPAITRAAAVAATPSADEGPADEPPPGELSAQESFEIGCELEAGSPAEAEEAYRQTLALDSRHVEAHLNLGRILHEQDDLPEAERHYRQALSIWPEDATAAFNLGVALEDQHRDSEALEAYERSMEADPMSADAFFNAARLYEQLGDKARAVSCLKRCRALQR